MLQHYSVKTATQVKQGYTHHIQEMTVFESKVLPVAKIKTRKIRLNLRQTLFLVSIENQIESNRVFYFFI